MHRLPLDELTPGTRELPPSSARYFARVLRLRVGDVFEAFEPRTGRKSQGRVLAVERELVRVELGLPSAAQPEAPLVLVQGNPKGDKLGDIVRDATELGATLIIPALCARSVARPGEDKLASRAERLGLIADEAARQCGRARAPTVMALMPWADAIETARKAAARGAVLWEEATVPLGDELSEMTSRAAEGVAFFIGPEGGLSRDEVAIAESAGFPARSLGTTILRTETAATAVLGAYRVLAGRTAVRRDETVTPT